MFVDGHGGTMCSSCSGEGQIPKANACTQHSISGEHFYCTSSSHHGNNIGQYHK